MTRPTKKTAAATAAEDQQTTPPEVPVEEAATTEPETTTAQAEVVEEQVPPETTPVVEGRPMDTEPERDWSEHNKLVKVLIWGSVVLVALVVIGVALLMWRNATPKTVENAPANASTVSFTTSDYDYTLAYLPHKGGVIIDGGFPAGSTPAQKKEIVAKAAAHDPFVLWYFLTRIYDLKDVPNMKALEDHDLRVTWHQKLLILLEASSFKDVSLDGKTFFNEGVNGKRQVTASSTRFSGGVRGTKITFGGKEKTVKNNCVNRQVKTCPRDVIVEKPKREKCPPAPPGFNPRTPDGGSKVFQPPQDNQDPAKATDPAPDLVRGVPDTIAEDQQDHSGTTEPTPHGTISDDPPPAGPPADDGASDVTSGTVPGLW